MKEIHTIDPVYQKDSKILILGSFPSIASREGEFFYHHKQNRFWKVLAYLSNEKEPMTIKEKKQLLYTNKIAVWDVIQSCTIENSSDSSISNVVVNDIVPIMKATSITKIFTNGGTASTLYKKHVKKEVGIDAIPLPSTSPANARYSLETLQKVWKEKIGDYL